MRIGERGSRIHLWAAILAGVSFAVLISVAVLLIKDALPMGMAHAATAAIRVAAANTLAMVAGAVVISLPLGMGAAVLRVEYLGAPRLQAMLDTLTATLISLPGIVVALAIFEALILGWGWPFSRMAGTVALAVLNWPWVTAVARDALDGVPDAMRSGSLALGATRFQTLIRVVLPMASPAFIRGMGVAVARVAGEAAALVYTAGVLVPARFLWSWWQPGGSLAVEVWQLRTEGMGPAAVHEAAAMGLVLLAIIFGVLLLANLWAERLKQRWGG